MAGSSRSLELLADEDRGAWREYLRSTRGQVGGRYEEVEPWAWSRLCVRLGAVQARRVRLLESARRG